MLALSANQARSDQFGRAQANQPVLTHAFNTAQAPANATPSSGDQIALSPSSHHSDPGYHTVKVAKWGSGKDDSLLAILHGQGYSRQEIYAKDANGLTFLQRVSNSNNLRNPNMVREGQSIKVPSKEKPAQTAGTPGSVPTSAAANTRQAVVNEVKVGKWGRDQNGSLYGILTGQGLTREQIMKKDASGDNLLSQVARANGLADPNKVKEGATLRVPNSPEALGQMQIPPRNGTRQTPVQKGTRPAELPRLEVPKVDIPGVELPVVEPPKVELPKTEPPKVETPVVLAPPVTNAEPPVPTTTTPAGEQKATAEMGLLLDGVKDKKFTRPEFQYLNALGNRYEETRAQFSKDGFSNEELKTLGSFETNYGVAFAKLYNSDNIKLTNNTQESSDPKSQLRMRHYAEGGTLWDGFSNGTVNLETAVNTMIRQRAEARAQGEK